ncbi:hypothetical protein HYV50_02255 [Candidatus Pacearchaeota archaeon]|nr:hypothetical protein [Candidatus Pacearchaeota archaeon]
MKKIIIIVLLVGLIGISSSEVYDPYDPDPVKNEEGQAKDFVYGSTSNLLYMRTIFTLRKGWNLIPTPNPVNDLSEPPRTINNYQGFTKPLGCGISENDVSGYQVKYRYLYVPNRGYVGGKYDSVQEEYDSAWQGFYLSNEMGGNDGFFSYAMTSQWVYSNIDCSYSLTSFPLRDIDKHEEKLSKSRLARGWNFIYFTPAFYQKNFKDVIGNCDVVSFNYWDAQNQKWLFDSEESKNVNTLLNMKIDNDNLFIPIVVKVSDTCNLWQTTIAPPPIP